MFDASPQVNGGSASPQVNGDVVVIDQERSDAPPHNIVMSVNGGPKERLVMDKIPKGATVYGDYNALTHRRGRSLSQAWRPYDLRFFLAQTEKNQNAVRQFSNHVFAKVKGGPDACVHLARKIMTDPVWARSSSRPVEPRTQAQRDETYRLHDEATWDFRQAEDDQKYGIEPPWYRDAVAVAVDLLDRDELAWLGLTKTGANAKVSRPLLAIYLSVNDKAGQRRLKNDRTPVSPDFARRYIARLHAQGRGRGVGGPIRACLRKIGNGNSPEKRAMGDRVFMKLAKAFTLPSTPEASRLPSKTESNALAEAA